MIDDRTATCRVSQHEFNRYREANQSSMIQCPKGCDYWCELEDEEPPQQDAPPEGHNHHGAQQHQQQNLSQAGYAHSNASIHDGGYGGYNGGGGGGLYGAGAGAYGGAGAGQYGGGYNGGGNQEWNVQHDAFHGGASTSAAAFRYENSEHMHHEHNQIGAGSLPGPPHAAGNKNLLPFPLLWLLLLPAIAQLVIVRKIVLSWVPYSTTIIAHIVSQDSTAKRCAPG